MHQLPKYVVLWEEGFIFTGSRPGGTQGDHVTAYALFQEILRSHYIKDKPAETIKNMIHLINTLNVNYDLFLAQANIEPVTEEAAGARGESLRLSVLAAQKQATKAKDEVTQRDVEAKTKEAESKRARGVVLRTEYQELKRLLAQANKELKSSLKILKTVESSVPVVHPDENTMTEIFKRLDDLSNQLLSDEDLERAISSGRNETVQEAIKGEFMLAQERRYEKLIFMLANSYLIIRNKQPYTAFPRDGHPAPPPDEADRVSKAIETLRNIQAEMIAKKNLSETLLTKASEAVWDLFWYPPIPEEIVSSYASSSDKTGKKRNNNLPDLAFVIAEHLETCFLAFPGFTIVQQGSIMDSFVEKVRTDWNLSKDKIEQIKVLIAPLQIDNSSMVDSQNESQVSESNPYSEDENINKDYKKLTHGHGEFSSESDGSEYIPSDQEESAISESSSAAPSNDQASSRDGPLQINTSTTVLTSSQGFFHSSPKRTMDHTGQNLSDDEMQFRMKK